LVEHPIKDHGYTREEEVMKPELQEKIKGHILKSWGNHFVKSITFIFKMTTRKITGAA